MKTPTPTPNTTQARSLLTALAPLAGAAILATLAPAHAQGTIYRCHALSGTLIFQDKPCDTVAGTREAQQGSAGEVMPAAAPPSDDGGPDLTERYQRTLQTQNLERQANASAAPSGPQVTVVPSTGVIGTRESTLPSSGVETYSGYGYSEGVYPANPYYPPYRYRGPDRNNGGAPNYDNRAQAQPSPLPAPGMLPLPTIQNDGLGQAPKPGVGPTGPGNVVSRSPGFTRQSGSSGTVSRDPNASTR